MNEGVGLRVNSENRLHAWALSFVTTFMLCNGPQQTDAINTGLPHLACTRIASDHHGAITSRMSTRILQ